MVNELVDGEWHVMELGPRFFPQRHPDIRSSTNRSIRTKCGLTALAYPSNCLPKLSRRVQPPRGLIYRSFKQYVLAAAPTRLHASTTPRKNFLRQLPRLQSQSSISNPPHSPHSVSSQSLQTLQTHLLLTLLVVLSGCSSFG